MKCRDLLKLAVKLSRAAPRLSFSGSRRMFSIVTRTWNPVTGCTHNCVYCWARRLAETKLRNTRKYRNGFRPAIHEWEFGAKFRLGEVVFVTDMGDLFCDAIPKEWILRVLSYVERFPSTCFLFLTKNPARYHEFLDYIPKNAILGATIETNRDELYRKYRVSGAPPPSSRYKAMRDLEWDLKFISIEPILDFDPGEFLNWIIEVDPVLVYVGYDNWGNRLQEPPFNKTLQFVEALSRYTAVFIKTLRSAWFEAGNRLNTSVDSQGLI